MPVDRNFDDLAQRFSRNIYASAKGKIRLAILQEDLQNLLLPEAGGRRLRILDAGCGSGQFSLSLAEQGHELVLCDHSAEMLKQASSLFKRQAPAAAVQFIHAPLQEIARHTSGKFDLILLHAVLEWLVEPFAALQILSGLLHPQGNLSLLFYNRNSLVLRNMIQGNFRKVASGNFGGHPKSLTPSNPLDPDEVWRWLASLGLRILLRSGVRVFHDYMPREIQQNRSFEDILEMERRYCRKEPFISLGRYVHVLAANN